MRISLKENREILKRLRLIKPEDISRAQWATLALLRYAEELERKFLFTNKVRTQELFGRKNYLYLKHLTSSAELTRTTVRISTTTRTKAGAANKPPQRFFRRAKPQPQAGWYPNSPRPKGFGAG